MITIPNHPEDLTPAWITEMLRDAGAIGDEVVVSARPDRAAGGIAVTSVVLRLHLEYDRPDQAAPASIVVKIRNPAYERPGRHYRTETLFYRDLAGDLDLAVPRCYHADLSEDGESFVLVLEDLTGFRPGHPLDGCDEAQTEAVLGALVDLHAAWWESPRLAAIEGFVKSYPPERVAHLTKVCGEAWPRFLDRGDYAVTPEVRARGEEVLAGLADDLTRLDRSPRTLVHQDIHVENLLLAERDGRIEPCFLDWQNAALGPPALDLSNAVGGNTRPDLIARRGRDWVEGYHRSIVARGVEGYPLDALVADHRAAVRWVFIGQAYWLSSFEPESEHDRRTITKEWERVAAAVVAMG